MSVKNDIIKIYEFTRTLIQKLNDSGDYIKRIRKLGIVDILYFLMLHFGLHKKSYTKTNNILKIDSYANCTNTSIDKKINKIGLPLLEKINQELSNFIYPEKHGRRIVGIDGSIVRIPSCCHEEGIKYGNKKELYCNVLFSSLYDLEKLVPIDYSVFKSQSERDALNYQSKYLKPKDVLVADRGYYSSEVIKLLNEKGIDFVLRVKSNAFGNLKNMKSGDITTIDGVDIRIIRFYSIEGGEEYIIVTSLMEENELFFKDVYKKRWHIETNFRELKYGLTLNDWNIKSLKKFKIKLLTHRLIMIYIGYFTKSIEVMCSKFSNYKIKSNRESCIDLFIERIVKIFFRSTLKKMTKKTIKKIYVTLDIFAEIIKKNLIYYISYRSSPRTKVSPSSKWGSYGNVFQGYG